MNRRDLFQRILGLAALPFLPKAEAKMPVGTWSFLPHAEPVSVQPRAASWAAWNTAHSKASLLVLGGGHQDHEDCAIYAFDMATRKWESLPPSDPLLVQLPLARSAAG